MGGKTATTTQKVDIPPEVMARYNAVNARAEQVAQQPFQQYGTTPEAFVAPLTPTQQAGVAGTNMASGMAQPFYGAATGLTLSGVQDVGPLTQGQIGYYQNPFTQAVVDPTLAALRQQQGQERSMLMGKQAMSGAFGGDRSGLERANLARQQNLATAQAIAPLYSQGYGQAVQTAAGQQGVVASDLARRMQAGQAIGGLGAAAQQAALQGAQAQLAAGQTQQQTEQAGKQALYNQFLQQQGYPFQVAQFLANIAMGTGALSGSTTTTEAPTGFFSDEREKTNIQYLGDGQYAYDYKEDVKRAEEDGKPMGPKRVGPMAQEIEAVEPGLVVNIDGHKVVKDASEGGGVLPQHAGLGFSLGGSASFDQDYVKKLISNPDERWSKMYGQMADPFGMKGAPGSTGRVPSATLPVGKVATAGALPQQRASGLAEAASTGRNIKDVLEMGQQAKKWMTSEAPKPQQPDRTIGEGDEKHIVNPGSATEYTRVSSLEPDREIVASGGFIDGGTVTGGKIDPTDFDAMFSMGDDRVHRLYGGETDIASPQGIYSPIGMGIGIPDEKNKYELKTAANAGKLGGGEQSDLSKAVSTAKDMYGSYKLASKAKDFASGLGKGAEAELTPIAKGSEITAMPVARPEGLGAAATPAVETTAAVTPAAETVAATTPAVETAATTATVPEALGAAGLDATLATAGTEAAGTALAAAGTEAAALGPEALLLLLVKNGGRINSKRQHRRAGGPGLNLPVDEETAKASNPGLGSILPSDETPEEERPRGLRVAEVKPTGLTDEIRVSEPAADFGAALRRTLKEEGGLNRRDTNGQPSLYGINAKYHPEFFKDPSIENATKIYKQSYWDAIDGDKLPAPLAHVAFDTAVIAGPERAKILIERAGGDPVKLLELRKQFQDGLIERDPEKYGKYANTWNTRVANLRQDVDNITEGKGVDIAEAKPTQQRVVSGAAASPGLAGPGRGNLDPYSAPFRATFGKLLPEDASEAMKSENFWVPMIAGLGSMLASNRPTLGGAIGEGLVGGTSAYTAMQKQQSDIAKVQADTEKVFSDIVDGSFKSIGGILHIRYRKPDGTYDWMNYGEYLGLDPKERPSVDPRVEKIIQTLGDRGVPPPGTPGAAQATVEAGTVKKDEAATTTAAGAKPATRDTAPAIRTVSVGEGGVPLEVGLTEDLIKQAQEATKKYTYAGEVERRAATDPKSDYFNNQQGRATGAQQQMQQIVPLAGAFASIPKDQSIAASGRLQEFAQPIVDRLSNLAAMAGKPDLIINPEILTKQGEVDKLVNQLQQGRLDASQLRAVEAFKAMASGIPNLLNTPGQQAALMAQLMTQAKREIDKDAFLTDWKNAGMGGNKGMLDYAGMTGREANRAFDNTFKEEFYARDRKAIENTFKDTIKEIKSPSTGGPMTMAEFLATQGSKITPDQKKAIAEKYGPNIFGYFGISK